MKKLMGVRLISALRYSVPKGGLLDYEEKILSSYQIK